MDNDTLIKSLNWRYAVKAFDAGKPLESDKLDTLLETLRLSASSFGLQPWHFICITDSAVKASLVEHSYGQQQVADAGAQVVLCRPEKFDPSDVDRFLDSTAATRKVPLDSLTGYGEFAKGFMTSMNDDQIAAWNEKQIYLALGNLLTSCAVLGVDACPMEGITPPAYDEILGLKEKGLRTVVACALGYRSDSDHHAGEAKVRYASDEVITRI